jgi:hypothetical protein
LFYGVGHGLVITRLSERACTPEFFRLL